MASPTAPVAPTIAMFTFSKGYTTFLIDRGNAKITGRITQIHIIHQIDETSE